jgi:lysine-specific demethylase 8
MEIPRVERVAPPPPEEFAARYMRASQPVILRGAIDDWPAMRRWSPAYLKERFGEREMTAVRTREGSLYDRRSGMNYETMRVGDYVDLVEANRQQDLYAVFRVHEVIPELFDDIVRPAYCRDARWFRSKFFFSGPDTHGLLHRDLPENLYAQVVGRKRFTLLHRRHTRTVHCHSMLSGVPNFSPVDAEAPDFERFPRFREAPVAQVELEPGDVLYIPSLWWHQACPLSVSMGINMWWVRGPMLAAVRAAELVMRAFKLRL